MLVFSTLLVNWRPSIFLTGLSTPPPPLTGVNKYRGMYVFIQCVTGGGGGGGIGGLRQINTCCQVPILVNLNKNLHLGFSVFINISSLQYSI